MTQDTHAGTRPAGSQDIEADITRLRRDGMQPHRFAATGLCANCQ